MKQIKLAKQSSTTQQTHQMELAKDNNWTQEREKPSPETHALKQAKARNKNKIKNLKKNNKMKDQIKLN